MSASSSGLLWFNPFGSLLSTNSYTLWNSRPSPSGNTGVYLIRGNANDRVLCYILRNIVSPDLPIPSVINLDITHSENIETRFIVPLNFCLNTLLGSCLNFLILRRLLRNDVGPGAIRTDRLLIVFAPGNAYDAGKFSRQYHVDSCTVHPLNSNPLTTSSSLMILGSVLSEPLVVQQAQLPAVGTMIRSAISEVFPTCNVAVTT